MLAIILSTVLLSSAGAADAAYSPETAALLERIDNRGATAIRARRPWTVGGEFGLNGLTGLGLNVSYAVNPHLSIDTGAGFALPAARIGLRARYNLLKSPVTPFIGVGAMYAFAGDGRAKLEVGGRDLHLQTHSAPLAQAVAGVAYTAPGGFSLVASLGWAELLRNKPNVEILSGNPTATEKKAVEMTMGSGPVAAMTLGYSF